jgi:pimeloyl-ACP methyl ester carboxylesterase
MASLHAVESRHFITVGEENSAPIDLYYEDHGSGSPVVLIHGYPLNGTSWEKQLPELLAAGHRVITYDRRGFGKSSQPTTGYDYDTFADDLNKVLNALELRDVALVGFSMGGGEVVRYCGKFGTDRISRVAILGGVPPYLLKGTDNPDGVDRSVFDGIANAIRQDRYAFFTDFFKNFFNADKLLGKRVTEDAMRACWNTAIGSSPTATLACVSTWYTDFRSDVGQVDVPTLVIHGDADRIVPFQASGAKTARQIEGAKLVVVKDGPHCITWTHPEVVNAELVSFLE